MRDSVHRGENHFDAAFARCHDVALEELHGVLASMFNGVFRGVQQFGHGVEVIGH